MDPNSTEMVYEFPHLVRLYKDGRIERTLLETIPPGTDLDTGVESKDIEISPEKGISARLFRPKITDPTQKLILLIYIHGGAFCIGSPFVIVYHKHLTTLTAQANVITLSVNYRLAPENPLPIAYEDTWTAIKWAASHVNGNGPEMWLNDHVDFGRVFFAGDSAGGNLAHNMAMQATIDGLNGLKLEGILLIHPYFGNDKLDNANRLIAPERPIPIAYEDSWAAVKWVASHLDGNGPEDWLNLHANFENVFFSGDNAEPVGSESAKLKKRARASQQWRFTCPTTTGSDGPIINPAKDQNLGSLGCGRVLIFVAEEDTLRSRGWYYKELLEKCEWDGVVEIFETKEENHVFHLMNPSCENVVALLNHVVSVINQN
ncbi:Alpha/beta hydrolase fold [Quillaja saponaria]|uniref:Alpha/beta hydrolase fold n=1 Tax=Quillaja saponaria TaxID=32244 RepID=A0AAD7M3I1_QUISA|nr:Alpha/beta hydrolase fold [Quillaja saponaria]